MAKAVADKILELQGTISAVDIVGTSVGQLGHANGYELVPPGGADVVTQLVSCTLVNEFETAAYTDGGNTTVNIGDGGAALTGLVSNANFIQAGADKVIEFVPLASTYMTHTVNKGLNLVSASAPTNPGTAAGVFHYIVRYRRIRARLA